MSQKSCCVPGCKVTRADGVPLHRFPDPDRNATFFQSWISKIGGDIARLDNTTIFNNKRVCHKHFEHIHKYTKKLCPLAIPVLNMSVLQDEDVDFHEAIVIEPVLPKLSSVQNIQPDNLLSAAKVSKPVLYKRDASPPSCAVMMLGDIIGIDFEYREPDLLGLEHRTPEFKKMNPMATIPVLKDGDFIVSESHAIMKYLLEKYGGEHREKLYPSDLKTRAIIDQCMFFNAGVMFNRLRNVAMPTIMYGLEGPSDKAREEVVEGFAVVEAYLKNNHYIAADHMTIADLCVASTVTAIQVIQKLDANKFPRCSEWLARLEETPCFQKINTPGSILFSQLMQHFWKKNKRKTSQ